MSETPRIQYAKTEDGASIAYTVAGGGPSLLNLPPLPISHVLRAPDLVPVGYQRWTDLFRYISYDSRGSGMSDRSRAEFSMQKMLLDLEAVLDRVQDGPLVLYGVFDSTPVAMAYAAQNPSRVSHLVLANGWTRYAEYDELPARAAERAMRGQDWVLYTETLARVLMGDMFDGQMIARLGAYIRTCIDQEALLTAYTEFEAYDVSSVLPSISVPTLVLYNQRNHFLSPSSAQRLASAIPGAELRVFDDVTYQCVPGMIADWLGIGSPDTSLTPANAQGFPLSELAARMEEDQENWKESDYVPRTADESAKNSLRTVLFTDLVGHTEMMQRLGDEKGRAVLREHERITREVLKAHGGTEVKTMGDGFMASFGSVTKAVECAIALQKAMESANSDSESPLARATGEGKGVRVRVGLNAGEPIEEDGDLFGATVILASRIAAKADGGEILVADTVRGLCSGKGFLFADRGEFVAKGFEEPVRVYEVSWRDQS